MSSPSIRRLSMADLTQDALEDLWRHGEDTLVERKRQPPDPPKFGAAAASFANTLGGWILLGVDDDGTVHGWEPPNGADVQSYLGELLRKQMDPLAPFVAAMWELDGKPVAVLRVFESADAPHIVRGTGAVYVRSSKGKEPVDDHRTLLELAQRGREAEAAARRRLGELPKVLQLLQPWPADPNPNDLRFILRAAPLTVTPALTQWPLTSVAAMWCTHFADRLVTPAPGPNARWGPNVETHGRAVAAKLTQHRDSQVSDDVTVMADSGGVLGIALRRGGHEGDHPRHVALDTMRADELLPLVTMIAAMLFEAEAYGRVVVDLSVVTPENASWHGQQREAPRQLHVAGELTVPVDDTEAAALASIWQRELQREVGIFAFEGVQPDP